MMDNSTGHTRKRENGLDEKQLGKFWGGNEYAINIRTTTVTEVGEYSPTYHVGQEQCLQFKDTDEGPYYLSPTKRHDQKYDRETGEVRTRERTRMELVQDLKRKGFKLKSSYSKEEIKRLARQNNIPLTVEERKIEPGWCNKSKGLLQILYERGFINPEDKISKYTVNGKKTHLDENKQVKEEFKAYHL